MSCCCTNPYNLGCASYCDGLTINYVAPADGVYSIIADYLGSVIRIDSTILAGEPLVFDTSALNAFCTYQFVVIFNGAALAFKDSEDNIYTCFDVSLRPQGIAAATIALDLYVP
jgi:hypothetical protein